MDFFETVNKRISYRGEFENTPVSKENLKLIMECGLAAPSGCNKQTTSLIAVDDKDILDKVYSMFSRNINKAPAVICVLTERINAYGNYCYATQDYSAAIENMLLAITALGYESCWYEGYLNGSDKVGQKIQKILNVPNNYELVCLLNVGMPKIKAERAVSKKPFEERAWFNGFKKN